MWRKKKRKQTLDSEKCVLFLFVFFFFLNENDKHAKMQNKTTILNGLIRESDNSISAV